MARGRLGNKIRTIVCAGCGSTVTDHFKPAQRYCSHACYLRSPRPERRTGAVLSCAQCGDGFYVAKGRAALPATRFCSLDCANTWQGRNKTDHVCKTCSTLFRWSPSRSRSYNVTYCSIPCRNADPEFWARMAEWKSALLRGRVTRVEVAGYAVLDSLGVTFERQVPFKGKFTPDATIAAARLVIQFDGDYWHDRKGRSTEERIRRRVALDRSQDAYVRACGWQVVRLWGSDLDSDPQACAETIRKHLAPPSQARP